jgi:hypothetical protein
MPDGPNNLTAFGVALDYQFSMNGYGDDSA